MKHLFDKWSKIELSFIFPTLISSVLNVYIILFKKYVLNIYHHAILLNNFALLNIHYHAILSILED